MTVYPLRRQPLDLQREILLATWQMRAVGLIADTGTGREKVIADTMAWQFLDGLIDRAVVIVPSATLAQWSHHLLDNIPDTIRVNFAVWPAKPKLEDGKLSLGVIAHEAIQPKSGHAAQTFMDRYFSESYGHSLLVLDEALEIDDARTYKAMALHAVAPLAGYRRVIMGALPRCPLALWSPYKLLSGGGPHLLGTPSPAAFIKRYMRGHGQTQEWVDSDDLEARIWRCSVHLDKARMDDLPGPIRATRDVVYRYKDPLTEAAREMAGKFVVFTHGDIEATAKVVEQGLWMYGNQIQGMVVRTSWDDRQVIRAFWQDPKCQALVINAHVSCGTLACASGAIFVDSCTIPGCRKKCEQRLEGENKLTFVSIGDAK